MAIIKTGSTFTDGKIIPKSINNVFADANGNISIAAGGSDELVTTNVVQGVLRLTTDKYQTSNIVDVVEIILPNVSKYTQLHLFFTPTTDITLILPNIKWQTVPYINANKTYEFVFTYLDSNWLGGCIVYV